MTSRLVRMAAAAALAFGLALPGNSQFAAAADYVAAPAPSQQTYARAGEARLCDDHSILNRIVSKFRHQVTHVPNLPDVRILDFHRIHQHRNYASSEDWPIGRRYCGATVELSDGGRRDIWYLIEEGMGFASAFGDGVEFCVSGFDRWNVYNGRCRVLR